MSVFDPPVALAMLPAPALAGASLVLWHAFGATQHLSDWTDARFEALGLSGRSAYTVRLCLMRDLGLEMGRTGCGIGAMARPAA